MKSIVLIDPSCVMIDSLVTSKKIKIDTLIVSSDLNAKDMKLKYGLENILSFESINNFYINQDIELDYEVIRIFRETELKVEHFLSRVTSDTNSIQHIYYSALFYWYERFKNNEIEGVMSSNIEFGSTFDSVIFDVAKYFNRRVFIAEVGLSNGIVRTNQLFDYSNKKYLSIDLLKYSLNGINKNDFLFNSIAKNSAKNKLKIGEDSHNVITELIKKILCNIGGYLLLTFPLLILGKHNNVHHTFRVSWWVYFKNYFYIKKMIRYYNSLCVEFDSTKKSIYFPLHMEPEAATQNRTISSNQIIIIKTISQNLPKGWILYVKEHPHQYKNLNKLDRYYYMSTIDKFRTKRYYDEICNVENVKLLCSDINSKDILANTQAVVSINGTVILESIINKIPTLTFSQNTTPFINVNGVLDVKNNSECKEYLQNLEGGYIPAYDNMDDILDNYFYIIENNEKNNFALLIEDLMLNHK